MLRTTTMTMTMTVIAVGLSIATSARAQTAPPPPCRHPPELRVYDQPKVLPPATDSRCEVVKGKCRRVALRGFLFLPDGKAFPGPRPILVFNHGSNHLPGQVCPIGDYFSELGYVVFVPHRRGHGESTGTTLADFVDKGCPKGTDEGECKMRYLHAQVADVKAAVSYARSLPGVDPQRVALMGASFGGIVSVFANTEDVGQKAIVDISGGSQSWAGNPAARSELVAAVEQAVAPAFLLEVMNDHSIEPTIELARAAGRACRVMQSALYPATDVNADGAIDTADYQPDEARDEAHRGMVRGVVAWGPAAHEFITRSFAQPLHHDRLCQGTSVAP